ncbi:Bacterial cadherin-like domain protein [compost metagenome]
MRDSAGATADARLTVVIQGANDAPVAQNDSALASDQVPAPQTSGNVLPNDSDVDGNDSLQVVGVRTGAENASGASGSVGQPLQGLYGTLVLNADGSYTYSIDLTNPQVLAAAGLGEVLQDVFTYTIGDLAGGQDQAELVITLDIAAPFIPAPAGSFFDRPAGDPFNRLPIPDVVPAIFISPVVERDARLNELSSWETGGSRLRLASVAQQQSESIGAGLGLVQGQFVSNSVQRSQRESGLDLAWLLGRQGRTSLSADGLLSDPSVFTLDPAHLTQGPAQSDPPAEPRNARGFTAQLHAAAQRLYPHGRNTPE